MTTIITSAFLRNLALFATASAVDTVRDGLQKNADRWFHWLVASSIVVAVGVAFEAPEATIALKRWYRHWKRLEVPPENERSLAIPASYLGLLLVILGVVGEGIFESMSSNAETTLRAHDEQVLGETIAETGTAAGSAERANVAAGQAQTKANDAKVKADGAEEKAEASDRKAGKAEAETNALNAQLDTEKKELDALDAKRTVLEKSLAAFAKCNAPRLLPRWKVGQTSSIDPLLPFSGTKVRIEFAPDAEARRAAGQITETLSVAGWQIAEFAPAQNIHDGVAVERYTPHLDNASDATLARILGDAARLKKSVAVIDFLHSYNWQANPGLADDEKGRLLEEGGDIAPGSLRIRVGLYPATIVFASPGEREFDKAIGPTEAPRPYDPYDPCPSFIRFTNP